MTDLLKACFDADMKGNVNVYRQNLQTTFVKAAADIADPSKLMYDDIAKAAALNTLRKLKTQLATAVSTNEESRAHRAGLLFRINNALEPK